MNLDDNTRTIAILFFSQLVNTLVLLQVFDWSGEQTAGVSALTGTAVTLFFRFFQSGQERGPA